ncbi:MAG: hypothetical protein K2L00_04235, partial [Muribaculaceae bacterium]|nr:hypothetical protein [Muribaculaceae bacterium]
AELRNIDNTGLAIGYSGPYATTYRFDSGMFSYLDIPEDANGVIGEALTNDGSLLVGSVSSSRSKAAYCKDGEWMRLPMPPEEEVLKLLKTMPETSSAKLVSGDGKVIFGYIGSFQIPCIWMLNDKGEYVPDLFPVRFLKLNEEDLNDDEKPLIGVSAFYLGLSNNGRYACLLGITPHGETGEMNVPIVYDTETKSLHSYLEYQDIDPISTGLYPIAISDDGTFIGTVGMPYFGSIGSFIMKSGETQAELFTDAFPEFNERYGESDQHGFNMCSGISADGRYISGYTYYSDDYNNTETPAYYESYVLDRGVGTVGVSGPAVDHDGSETIYSIDGRSLRSMAKGINIVRNADGSVSKVIKK